MRCLVAVAALLAIASATASADDISNQAKLDRLLGRIPKGMDATALPPPSPSRVFRNMITYVNTVKNNNAEDGDEWLFRGAVDADARSFLSLSLIAAQHDLRSRCNSGPEGDGNTLVGANAAVHIDIVKAEEGQLIHTGPLTSSQKVTAQLDVTLDDGRHLQKTVTYDYVREPYGNFRLDDIDRPDAKDWKSQKGFVAWMCKQDPPRTDLSERGQQQGRRLIPNALARLAGANINAVAPSIASSGRSGEQDTPKYTTALRPYVDAAIKQVVSEVKRQSPKLQGFWTVAIAFDVREGRVSDLTIVSQAEDLPDLIRGAIERNIGNVEYSTDDGFKRRVKFNVSIAYGPQYQWRPKVFAILQDARLDTLHDMKRDYPQLNGHWTANVEFTLQKGFHDVRITSVPDAIAGSLARHIAESEFASEVPRRASMSLEFQLGDTGTR